MSGDGDREPSGGGEPSLGGESSRGGEPALDRESHLDGEPVEHARYARHLRDLAEVSQAGEVELVAAVLRDADPETGRSAVVSHFGERAPRLLADAHFPVWSAAMVRAVAGDPFLTRRLAEWTLIRAVVLGEEWSAEDLTSASDWCQRAVVDHRTATPPEALAVLAVWGRTRWVRAGAGRRLAGSGWR